MVGERHFRNSHHSRDGTASVDRAYSQIDRAISEKGVVLLGLHGNEHVEFSSRFFLTSRHHDIVCNCIISAASDADGLEDRPKFGSTHEEILLSQSDALTVVRDGGCHTAPINQGASVTSKPGRKRPGPLSCAAEIQAAAEARFPDSAGRQPRGMLKKEFRAAIQHAMKNRGLRAPHPQTLKNHGY